jgi:hypothetical protein
MKPRAMLLAALLAAAPGALAQTPDAAPPAGPEAPPAPDPWLPRPVVDLVGLDKVSARTTAISGPVGQPLHFGTLTVLVRACVVRPPDAAPDAAAFLEISDSRVSGKPFSAWMLLSEPSLSIFEHPVYDIRLVGCRAGT